MQGRVAVVTGAGSGIGRAVSLALGAQGYRVVLAGRKEAALSETAAMMNLNDDATLVVATDVTRPAEVDRLFQEATTRFGRVDLLFNNAGANVPGVALEDLTVEAWHAVVGVNLNGAFLCLQAAFRVMKNQAPQGGRIINNGSISAHSPRPDSIAYTASKHAVTGLTKSAALDGRKYNIACGQIDIGNAATDMASRMTSGVKQADGSIRAEPVMDVARIGDAVVFMDSLPLDANVPFMTVMATTMPYIGRG